MTWRTRPFVSACAPAAGVWAGVEDVCALRAPSAGRPDAATPPSAAADATTNLRLVKPHAASGDDARAPSLSGIDLQSPPQLLVHVYAPDVQEHQVNLLNVRRHVGRHCEDVVGLAPDEARRARQRDRHGPALARLRQPTPHVLGAPARGEAETDVARPRQRLDLALEKLRVG